MKKITLRKSNVRWFWYLLIFFVLTFYLIGSIFYPSIRLFFFSSTFYLFCVYLVIDFFALAVGYAMLKKFNSLISWKSVVYLAVIVAGSFAINAFLPGLAYRSALFFILTAYAFLFLLNFVMSKMIFTLNAREASLIGLLVGLVHALMAVMATPILH